MTRFHFSLQVLLSIVFLLSLAWAVPATAQKTKAEEPAATCAGLPFQQRTRIAVATFTVSTPSAQGKFGDNLSAMLSNVLVESNCFRVLESSKNLESLFEEIALGNKGAVKQGTGAEAGQMLGAQLLISGEITEFAENEGGGAIGALVGKSLSAVGVIKAHVGFILKIVNPTTREIITSRSFERKVTKVGLAAAGGVPAAGLGYKSKAMADAIEEAIMESSKWLVNEKDMMLDALGAGSTGGANKVVFNKDNCPAMQNGQAPTVMVIIPEIHITQRIPDPAGETEIIRKLIQAGFKVLDPTVYKAIRETPQLSDALKDASAASKLGSRFGADIIIIGEAFSESAGNASGGMRSCRARVEARAVRTSDARILAADGQHAGGVDVSEFNAAKVSLRNAGALMGDYFINQLCQASQGSSAPILNTSEIILANVNFTSIGKIETMLKSQKGVESVKKTLAGTNGRIEISHSCPLDDIANSLASGKAGLAIEITGFGDQKIEGKVK